MDTRPLPQTNFACLNAHDEQLMRLGMLAEKYFTDDPNTSLLKQRQFAELMTQLVATKVGSYKAWDENQFELLRRLQGEGILPRDVAELFHQIRKTGNDANHEIKGNHTLALGTLKLCWQLAVWFHRAFKDRGYKSGPFIPPAPPKDESAELRAELDRLSKALAEYKTSQKKTTEELQLTAAQLKSVSEEKAFWEQVAHEADQANATMQAQLAAQQVAAAAQPRAAINRIVSAAGVAATEVALDEAATRRLIDAQLQEAGWIVDSERLTYGKDARPQKNRNIAIAEWPTGSGPADYVLFIGLTPVAVVEAKRANKDVSASLQQAQRYSRTFIDGMGGEVMPDESPWGEFKIPFAFSTNGRAYLPQIKTKSGIWFRDLRRPSNHGRPLDGWYSPEGLAALMQQDEAKAHDQLKEEPFNYGFTLRPYQQNAILAVEDELRQGKRAMLLAMATGTGKTKTCIALIYRLLTVKRFRRILFLVDRSALGEQAANAFKDTRMASVQTFADIFGIKELEDQSPDADTAVHIATVQGMVKRALYPSEDQPALPVDQYDCIIVDECHRGYLLDREMSETELAFRNQDDYISKYRRVLEYFDAVKIGLTATPALHTVEIFGAPVFTYSYRDAVIEGFLVDHDPPITIHTQLAKYGIQWKKGDDVKAYNTRTQQVELFKAPDEINVNVDGFNRKVITEDFNRVVCKWLANELEPSARQKTLIFCVNDLHADMVVQLLKEEFEAVYAGVDDDAVMKITGSADKPLELIRRFKNEHYPSVAVTVDLLTTGIDVPAICNLVFLRRVNSRILFDQMLGRATRLCPEIEKETFRVFDAVGMVAAMKGMTAMQPVVVNPAVTFAQLAGELATVQSEAHIELARDQFIAKLQRKKRTLSERTRSDFESRAGQSPDDFIQRLQGMPLSEIAAWFTQNPDLGEILDRTGEGPAPLLLISDKPDRLLGVETGYPEATRPEDYLRSFNEYIKTHRDEIPALVTVLTRPRDLTRKQLRELMRALDDAGFTEANLNTAWRQMKNEQIAARIIGFIRKAALDETLLPFDQRVDQALSKLLRSRNWTTPQQNWLRRIAGQTKANLIVDREALDDPDQMFRKEIGGYQKLDKLFNGELGRILGEFNDAVWATNL